MRINYCSNRMVSGTSCDKTSSSKVIIVFKVVLIAPDLKQMILE